MLIVLMNVIGIGERKEINDGEKWEKRKIDEESIGE